MTQPVKPKLFLDSGAYSAKTQGAHINILEYARFIKKYERYFDVVAGLDVIHNPEATAKNQKWMDDFGVKTLPCYHAGEDPKWLKDYVERYEYIAVGGTARAGSVQRFKWFDELWSKYLTDSNGNPLAKVHGFGLTGLEMMSRYPWYSVDSTSWLKAAAMGRAVVVSKGTTHSLSVSNESKDLEKAGWHIDNVPPDVSSAFSKLTADAGFSMEDLQRDYKVRFICNGKAYTDYARGLKPKPFHVDQPGIFDTPIEKPKARWEQPPWDYLTMYLAGNPGACGITDKLMLRGYDRLLSYHYIDQGDHWDEARVVLDGWKN